MVPHHAKPLNGSKFLFPLFLILIFLVTFSNLNSQVKNSGSNEPVSFSSDEVYKTIANFFNYDRNIPLNAIVVSSNEFNGSKKEKIVFTGVDNSKVPSYLITPMAGDHPHPVVLLVDGIYGSKDRWLDDNSWPIGGKVTKELLKNGFAVMALDAVYHGERSYENGFAPPPWPFDYPILARDMFIHTAIEYRRAIDFLGTRNDIDTSRIGILGLSMGGIITFELTGIDPRIKSAVAGLAPLWKEAEFQAIVPQTFARHVKCNSFLMFMGSQDGLYTMEDAHRVFNVIPVENKEFVEYDVGHEPPEEYVGKVSEWFKNFLK